MNQLSSPQLQQGELLSLLTVWETLYLLQPTPHLASRSQPVAVPDLGPEEGVARGLGVGEGAAQPHDTGTILGPPRSVTCLL